ncbi:hypothetical protein [Ketobacter sp.]|uniref:hypothetical protein n=1 Tax=Ketobacter sp. TaxID=2083498 RepID=UPI000F15CF9C|nr:hypothetical protein [Ketobacter sp.]RLU01853.1 MAG: hypothetical protein D9N14_00700 [Ketobacter sp.]
MLGSHKFITAGYFLVAGIGGFIAYQQSGFSLPAAPSAALASSGEQRPVSAAGEPSAAHNTSTPTRSANQNPTLLAAQQALALADAIEAEPDAAFDDLPGPAATGATASATVNRPWQPDPKQQRTPSFMLHDDVREYEVVNTDAAATYPGEGERVQLTLLNGKQVTVNVKNSTVTRNGDYSWSGHLDGYGDDYPVVMTYGKTSTFAMITTPEGSYSMESVEGVGWLYKNPAEHELTRPGHEDFLEIPEQHSQHPAQHQSHSQQDEDDTHMET